MNHFPSRPRALAALFAAGLTAGTLLPASRTVFLPGAAAQTVDGAPEVAPARPADSMARSDVRGRHLAPHDTFYVLSYLSVKTDTGVEGFEPGQEVHLVEVHRPTHTLVVSDGRAQVEVAPSKLTNDMDIAALVRQKDQANQARIAAYTQAQEAAYQKYEREAAESTARDLEHHQQEQAAEVRAENQTQQPRTPAAQPVEASVGGNGYYGSGGDGYGSPYSYFSGGTVIVEPRNRGTGTAPAARGAASGDRAGGAARTNGAAAGGVPAAQGTATGSRTGAGGRP